MQTTLEEQTWQNDKRWRDGRISDGSGAVIVFMLIFALIWNAISWPVFVLAFNDRKVGNAIWLVGLFPAIGLGLGIGLAFLIVRR